MIRKTRKTTCVAAALAAAMCIGACASGPKGLETDTTEATQEATAPEAKTTEVAKTTAETGSSAATTEATAETGTEDIEGGSQMDYSEVFKNIKLTKGYKGVWDLNPIISQHYGADPYAMVYGDTVYFYMTADAYEYEADGTTIKENSYSKIRSLYVVSTKDMVNFTDHGEIMIAGEGGATKWAHNSWAPAAAWKMIDGKPKFFLYFADNGGGIGVVTSDSPVGPFVDELGHGLIRRDMENCGNVAWLFDPAVLVDDDGTGYIYFGGGIPYGTDPSHPMTARCAQLGEDMMSLVDVPKTIDAPFLFEDSGIHKYGDTYYYTYCSNFNVDEAGTKEYGFESGEIIVMESKNPLGPFTFKERILKNPGAYWGEGGNNHHCVFNFKGQWYITYHTRMLELAQGIRHGYRSTNIEAFEMGEDGTIGLIPQTRTGREQVVPVDPYETINGATFCTMGGVDTAPADEVSKKYGCGNLLLTAIDTGDFVKIQGVDFGDEGAKTVKATVRTNGKSGVVRISTDAEGKKVLGYLPIESDGNETTVCTAQVEGAKGLINLYFTFSGDGYEIVDWTFEK
ncbi:MAG: family 43 glycosylhydrolase [Lachnospiraceae bacterium]|nr:family 43 glycosylhydrolase [Lachnospiraceae bacterium]